MVDRRLDGKGRTSMLSTCSLTVVVTPSFSLLRVPVRLIAKSKFPEEFILIFITYALCKNNQRLDMFGFCGWMKGWDYCNFLSLRWVSSSLYLAAWHCSIDRGHCLRMISYLKLKSEGRRPPYADISGGGCLRLSISSSFSKNTDESHSPRTKPYAFSMSFSLIYSGLLRSTPRLNCKTRP